MIKWINKKRNKKGFTLVELVVVIAILGILAAIAVPRFGTIQENARRDADIATYNAITNALTIAAAQGDVKENVKITANNGVLNAVKVVSNGVETEYELLQEGAEVKLDTNIANGTDGWTWTITNGNVNPPGITDGVWGPKK